MDAYQKHVGDSVKHAASYHTRPETHGTEDEPDGIEHASHTSGGYEYIDILHATIYLAMGIAGGYDSFKKALGRDAVLACFLLSFIGYCFIVNPRFVNYIYFIYHFDILPEITSQNFFVLR